MHFVEEVFWEGHCPVSCVPEGAPLLIGRLRQVQDTPQVL